MRSILLIHKPHYRQRSRVCKAGTGITVDVSSEERTSDLPGRWKHVTCFVIGRKDTRLADWRWRQYSRSLCDALPATLQYTKPHYRQPVRVCKAGTVVTVDVSSEERTSDHPGRWKHRPASWLVGRTRDWLTGYGVRGRVLLSWPVGWCFKSREAWASALCRWSPGRSEVDSSFQPAVHSNQFPGHPPPLLPTQVPGPQGRDWEWLKMKFLLCKY